MASHTTVDGRLVCTTWEDVVSQGNPNLNLRPPKATLYASESLGEDLSDEMEPEDNNMFFEIAQMGRAVPLSVIEHYTQEVQKLNRDHGKCFERDTLKQVVPLNKQRLNTVALPSFDFSSFVRMDNVDVIAEILITAWDSRPSFHSMDVILVMIPADERWLTGLLWPKRCIVQVLDPACPDGDVFWAFALLVLREVFVKLYLLFALSDTRLPDDLTEDIIKGNLTCIAKDENLIGKCTPAESGLWACAMMRSLAAGEYVTARTAEVDQYNWEMARPMPWIPWVRGNELAARFHVGMTIMEQDASEMHLSYFATSGSIVSLKHAFFQRAQTLRFKRPLVTPPPADQQTWQYRNWDEAAALMTQDMIQVAFPEDAPVPVAGAGSPPVPVAGAGSSPAAWRENPAERATRSSTATRSAEPTLRSEPPTRASTRPSDVSRATDVTVDKTDENRAKILLERLAKEDHKPLVKPKNRNATQRDADEALARRTVPPNRVQLALDLMSLGYASDIALDCAMRYAVLRPAIEWANMLLPDE